MRCIFDYLFHSPDNPDKAEFFKDLRLLGKVESVKISKFSTDRSGGLVFFYFPKLQLDDAQPWALPESHIWGFADHNSYFLWLLLGKARPGEAGQGEEITHEEFTFSTPLWEAIHRLLDGAEEELKEKNT